MLHRHCKALHFGNKRTGDLMFKLQIP